MSADYTYTKELLTFIEESPSPFHVIKNMKKELIMAGFLPLKETDKWSLVPGGSYYVTRNGSSIIAFRMPKEKIGSYHIVASHSDSPTFRIKENAEMGVEGVYTKLNVEKYGGMLMVPWFDRPLSVAGRVFVETQEGLESRLVNIDRDLLLIPNVAIHMNREVNTGYNYNPQVDLLPLYGDGDAKGTFDQIIADSIHVEKDAIISRELSLYNRQKGSIWGAKNEFVSAPKLDDLMCAFASLKAMVETELDDEICPIMAVFDNEEVGSSTKQGAASTFLKDTLIRIKSVLEGSDDDHLRILADSFMVSADNGHALHPNHPEKSDPTNRPKVNGGVLIKHSANQKYTTDAMSAAVMRSICKKAGVPFQDYHNRSDIIGGSTLGNLSGNQVAVPTVDIGVAQLAMHSCYETAGAEDTENLMKMMKYFYKNKILIVDNM